MASGVHVAVSVVVAAFVLTGCGGDAEPSGAPPSRAGGSGSPTATAPEGGDFPDCQAGTCEVTVRKGDRIALDRQLGVETISVGSIADGQIGLDLTFPEGTDTHVSVRGGGQVRSSGQGATAELPGNTSGTINQLSFTVVSVDGDQAVLRLRPK